MLLRNERIQVGSSGEVKSPFSPGKGLGERFTNVTAQAGIYSSRIGYGLSAAIADFNQDSLLDIYVCNDFSEHDYYYLNQGDGTFRESIRELTGHTSNFSMGSDVGDFNNDRWPDLFTLDMRPRDETILKATVSAESYTAYRSKRERGFHDKLAHNALQWNRGDGNFSEIAEMAGVAASDWSWSCLIEDFDLDGRQDIFVANGIERRPNHLDYLKFVSSALAGRASNLEVIANMPSGHVANNMFRQTAEWAFEDVAEEWGLAYVGSSTGAAVADFDRDGDPDLVLNNLNAPAKIYENTHQPQKRSLGTAFNPSAQSPPRCDPDTKQCPQRGMMSQSEGRYGPDRGTVSKYAKWYTVKAAGISVGSVISSTFFDRYPLWAFGPNLKEQDFYVVWKGKLVDSSSPSR
ncbi:MAG: VCBS repeat-containing protein, partial [Bacteroidota bacterium]